MKNASLIVSVLLLAISTSGLTAGVANGQTITVKADGTGDYPTIQAAIDAANNGDTVIVLDGTYRGTGNRDIDFNGKAITVRSDNGPDNCIIDVNASLFNPNYRGFYFHSGEDANSVVDGFTIINGYMKQLPELHDTPWINNPGGGIFCNGSSPTVTNITFSENFAGYGGGMYNYAGSNPIVTYCTFNINDANQRGGGMGNYDNSSPTVVNCTFSGNDSKEYGGGMYNGSNSSPTLTNCTFSGNTTIETGGGMYNDSNSSPTLTNCTFGGNSAAETGGGMANYNNSSPTVTNCSFSGNTAEDGGGMYDSNSSPMLTNCTFSGNSAETGGGMYDSNNSSPTLTNCILWGNSAASDGDEIALYNSSAIDVNYCDIQGGQAGVDKDGTSSINWGVGNIDADPNFFDANNPDPNLRDYHLRPGSPCIDAGDNNSIPADTADLDGDGNTTEPTPFDLNGFPRFIDDLCSADTGNGTPPIVDMGAYEFLRSDIDSNRTVDLGDFSRFASYWRYTGCGVCAGADLTCDGNVNYYDLKELTDNWLAGL